MALAIVYKVGDPEPLSDGTVKISLEILCNVPEQGKTDLTNTSFIIAPADTPQTMRQKMSAAVLAEMVRLNYPISGSNIILPSYQKG